MPENDKSRPSAAAMGSVEHMEEEVRALEGEDDRRRWLPWALGVPAVVVLAVAAFFLSGRANLEGTPLGGVSEGGVLLDLLQPRPESRLAAPPTAFSWESLTGRHDYLFKLMAEGSTEPILTRAVRTSSLDLAAEETRRLERGKIYVWTVAARQRDGAVLGSGRARFRVD